MTGDEPTPRMGNQAWEEMRRAVAQFSLCWCGCLRAEHDEDGVCGDCGCQTFSEVDDEVVELLAPPSEPVRNTVWVTPVERYL